MLRTALITAISVLISLPMRDAHTTLSNTRQLPYSNSGQIFKGPVHTESRDCDEAHLRIQPMEDRWDKWLSEVQTKITHIKERTDDSATSSDEEQAKLDVDECTTAHKMPRTSGTVSNPLNRAYEYLEAQ